jgi:hypothetical protein
LRFTDQGRLRLGLPARAVLTAPFAAPAAGGGVWLTVTRRHAGSDEGCYLAHSPDGRRFGAARRSGPGEGCRTVALPGGTLVQTFQRRRRRTQPYTAWLRRSRDGGRTWSAPQRVGQLRETFDPFPLVGPGSGSAAGSGSVAGSGTVADSGAAAGSGSATGSGSGSAAGSGSATGSGAGSAAGPGARSRAGGWVLHVARYQGRTALFVHRLDRAGRPRGTPRRLTPFSRKRLRRPAALRAPRGVHAYFGWEGRPLDFDVRSLALSRSIQ